MESRITRSEFEIIINIFMDHIGEVVQYIARDRAAHCEFPEDVRRQMSLIGTWDEEDLKYKIWKAVDAIELFVDTSFNGNEYWKVEEALNILWSNKEESTWLHAFDIKSMISSMVLNLFYMNKNKMKVMESLKN